MLSALTGAILGDGLVVGLHGLIPLRFGFFVHGGCARLRDQDAGDQLVGGERAMKYLPSLWARASNPHGDFYPGPAHKPDAWVHTP